MGTLAQGFGFGSAGSAAQSSLQWGSAGVGLTALGEVAGGVGKFQQAQYASAVAQNNAVIASRNANAAINAGQYEESASKLRTGETVGAQRAAFGANGVDVNIGSPARVQESTKEVGAMDAAMIHYNAARAAYGYLTEAKSQTAQAQLDKMAGAGALTEGIFGAGAGILGGASALAGKAAQFKLSFGDSYGANP